MHNTKVYKMSVATVFPHYLNKAEKKGRNKADVDRIICWLTGYSESELQQLLDSGCTFENFFSHAPQLNINREKITGVICGYRVENISDPLMQNIRYLDKLIDELSKGKSMDKILRK